MDQILTIRYFNSFGFLLVTGSGNNVITCETICYGHLKSFNKLVDSSNRAAGEILTAGTIWL